MSRTLNQIRIEGINTINRRMVEKVVWLSAHGVRLPPIVERALPIAEDLALPIDEGHLPIAVERGFGLRWSKNIEFKRKGFLSIGERALARIVEGTLCGMVL